MVRDLRCGIGLPKIPGELKMNVITGDMQVPARERVPSSGLDIAAIEHLKSPYEDYRVLRDTGPAVWLEKANVWAITRYDDVRHVLKSANVFLNGYGSGLNDQSNSVLRGTTQSSDGDLHRRFRRTVQTPLMPTPLKALQGQFEETARNMVAGLPDGERFEGVTSIAHVLPLSIVSNLVGLPEEGRGKMMEWGAAAFEVLGPPSDRQRQAFETLKELVAYANSVDDPDRLKPGSWGQSLYTWVEKTGIPREKVVNMILDYTVPSLDTTISATASLMYYLGTNPDQYQLLRSDPKLITRAIEEAIRLESPARWFSRVAAEDTEIGGTGIRAGERVLIFYGSANRDERRWTDPERFDVTRQNQGQLGFGHGEHQCVGMPLARMEIAAIIEAMIYEIDEIHIHDHAFGDNQAIRALTSLTMSVKRR
jgi:cytochrome P450